MVICQMFFKIKDHKIKVFAGLGSISENSFHQIYLNALLIFPSALFIISGKH